MSEMADTSCHTQGSTLLRLQIPLNILIAVKISEFSDIFTSAKQAAIRTDSRLEGRIATQTRAW